MREITFSLYDHVRDNDTRLETRPWPEWIPLFAKHAVRGLPTDTCDKKRLENAKNGPCLILGEVEGLRKAANVRAIHALALDLEGRSDEDLLPVLDIIVPFEWCLYTTHKSGAAVVGGQTRLRVILPLAESIAPADFPAAWQGLQKLVGGANDPRTKDLARLHFLPSTFNPACAFAEHHEGEWYRPIATGTITTAKPPATVPASLDLLLEEIKLGIKDKLRGVNSFDEHRKLLLLLLDGRALAEPGERHSKILSSTLWLAKRLPEISDEVLEVLFAKSLAAMQAQPNGGPISQSEIRDAYKGALTRVAETDKTKKHIEAPATNPYTTEELGVIAAKQGWTVDELDHKWLIQKDGIVWLLKSDGTYGQAHGEKDAPIAVVEDLSRAPLQLWTITQNGYKYKTPGELARQYGMLANKVTASLAAQYTRFDAEARILIEAVTPLRKLEPVFSADIDGWLKTFGEDYPDLVNWLACAPDLEKNLCAIYIDGEKDAGKTLFAVGLARLWSKDGTCSNIDQVLGNFNEEITKCPLIFIDEQMPKFVNNQSVSGKIRELLGNKTRSLRQKYRNNIDLTGAIRLVLAANNDSLLDEMQAKSAPDMEAVAQRFLYVKLTDAPVKYLERYRHEQLKEWETHAIAEHCLWLNKNHIVEHSRGKFWVEGTKRAAHELLMSNSKWTSLVCEWLIRYLLNPKPFHADSAVSGLIKIRDNQLLVNEQAVADKWDLYLTKTRQDPIVREISNALKSLSLPERKQLRWAHSHVRYHQIVLDHLLVWSEKNGIGDPQNLTDRISGALPMDVVVTPQRDRDDDENDEERAGMTEF